MLLVQCHQWVTGVWCKWISCIHYDCWHKQSRTKWASSGVFFVSTLGTNDPRGCHNTGHSRVPLKRSLIWHGSGREGTVVLLPGFAIIWQQNQVTRQLHLRDMTHMPFHIILQWFEYHINQEFVHKRYPTSSPNGRDMECLLWGFSRKLTTL